MIKKINISKALRTVSGTSKCYLKPVIVVVIVLVVVDAVVILALVLTVWLSPISNTIVCFS